MCCMHCVCVRRKCARLRFAMNCVRANAVMLSEYLFGVVRMFMPFQIVPQNTTNTKNDVIVSIEWHRIRAHKTSHNGSEQHSTWDYDSHRNESLTLDNKYALQQTLYVIMKENIKFVCGSWGQRNKVEFGALCCVSRNFSNHFIRYDEISLQLNLLRFSWTHKFQVKFICCDFPSERYLDRSENHSNWPKIEQIHVEWVSTKLL